MKFLICAFTLLFNSTSFAASAPTTTTTTTTVNQLGYSVVIQAGPDQWVAEISRNGDPKIIVLNCPDTGFAFEGHWNIGCTSNESFSFNALQIPLDGGIGILTLPNGDQVQLNCVPADGRGLIGGATCR